MFPLVGIDPRPVINLPLIPSPTLTFVSYAGMCYLGDL